MRVYASAEMTLTDTNDGISVTGIDRYYMASSSSSGITVASPGWKPDPQETNPISRYHWSYEVVNYSSGPPVPSKPAIIGVYGKDGIAGKDGVGIKTTTITYAKSTSGTVKPTKDSDYDTKVPTLTKGNYLWTKTVWTYTDNTTETGYSVSYIAKDGNNGSNGIAGKDGVGISNTDITYAKSTSGTVKPTSGYTETIPKVDSGQYLWTKTTWTYTDNTTEDGYSVAKMGETGATGSILGENQWVGHKYSYPGSTRIYPSFDHIQGLNPIATQIFDDSTRFTFSDDYYIAHFQSNLYVNIDKQITTTVSHDDDLTIYCDGEVVVSKNTTIVTPYNITFNLKAGWNKIDVLLHELAGGDHVTFGTKLSSLVEHLSYIKGADGVDSATLAIMTPDGTTVRDTTNSLRLDSKLFVGGKEVTASSYKWYYSNGSSTITQSTAKNTSIGATLIKNSLPIFLDATYNGTTYTSSVTINDISDVYTSIILGVATFKNGKGSNTYTVKLYRNGEEIDPGGSIYSYEWEKLNSQGVRDTKFTKKGKTITINASEIDNTNLFNCYIYTK